MSLYKCSSCYGVLNVNGYIALQLIDELENKGVVLLSEELGDYRVHFSRNLIVNRGDNSEFYCPHCQHSVKHPEKKNLVQLIMTNETGVESTVVFSSIYGEHSSFVIREEELVSYGKNALKFTDPEWYMKL